jgi:hypothetical protein
MDDVNSIDLNEGINRIEIGLETGIGRSDVERRLKELGIPQEAVVFGSPGPIILENGHTLRDRNRPLRGGLQIDPVGVNPCTFSFNAIRHQFPPSSVFLTASHCTIAEWADDGAAMFQPVETNSGDRIGHEVHDPPPFRCGPFWDRHNCRYSDAAMVLHETSSFEQGFIVRTVGRVGPGRWLQGSLEIDANNPRLMIIGESPTSLQGDEVDKIGRTTGWTWGQVTHTCRDLRRGVNRRVCQDLATYSSDQGDSGSPVFIWHGDNTATLRGVHWGSDGGLNLAIFSPLSGVKKDLGPMTTVLAVAVEIVGPSVVELPGTYTWEAFPAGGNGHYSYQWSVHYFNTGQTDVLGTAKTQSLDVWRELGHFEMRVTVSSAQTTNSDAHFVNNNIDGGPREFRRKPRLRP